MMGIWGADCLLDYGLSTMVEMLYTNCKYIILWAEEGGREDGGVASFPKRWPNNHGGSQSNLRQNNKSIAPLVLFEDCWNIMISRSII